MDHGKIEYEPFRKNFYVEVPELAKMTQEGKYKYEQNTFWCARKQHILIQCGVFLKKRAKKYSTVQDFEVILMRIWMGGGILFEQQNENESGPYYW